LSEDPFEKLLQDDKLDKLTKDEFLAQINTDDATQEELDALEKAFDIENTIIEGLKKETGKEKYEELSIEQLDKSLKEINDLLLNARLGKSGEKFKDSKTLDDKARETITNKLVQQILKIRNKIDKIYNTKIKDEPSEQKQLYQQLRQHYKKSTEFEYEKLKLYIEKEKQENLYEEKLKKVAEEIQQLNDANEDITKKEKEETKVNEEKKKALEQYNTKIDNLEQKKNDSDAKATKLIENIKKLKDKHEKEQLQKQRTEQLKKEEEGRKKAHNKKLDEGDALLKAEAQRQKKI
jgi:hypothetical protein